MSKNLEGEDVRASSSGREICRQVINLFIGKNMIFCAKYDDMLGMGVIGPRKAYADWRSQLTFLTLYILLLVRRKFKRLGICLGRKKKKTSAYYSAISKYLKPNTTATLGQDRYWQLPFFPIEMLESFRLFFMEIEIEN